MLFTLTEKSLCVVEKHVAAFTVGFDKDFNEVAPSWGRHGGPLTLAQSGSEVTLTRWKASGDATSALVVDSTVGPIDLGIAANEYVNRGAVDLPFLDATALGWASFGKPDGELILLDASAVATRFDAEGLFALVGLAGDTKDRFVYSGLSPVGAPGANSVALYTADICGKALCASGTESVHTEGDASGPVAVDEAGNVIAVFPDLAKNTQSMRGFAAAAIAPGSMKPTSEELFSRPGAGASLAAIAPTDDASGYAFFQPTLSFEYKNLIVQRYTADAELATDGPAHDALIPTKPNTDLRIFTDDTGRLWVGIATDAAKGESTFFVLARDS